MPKPAERALDALKFRVEAMRARSELDKAVAVDPSAPLKPKPFVDVNTGSRYTNYRAFVLQRFQQEAKDFKIPRTPPRERLIAEVVAGRFGKKMPKQWHAITLEEIEEIAVELEKLQVPKGLIANPKFMDKFVKELGLIVSPSNENLWYTGAHFPVVFDPAEPHYRVLY